MKLLGLLMAAAIVLPSAAFAQAPPPPHPERGPADGRGPPHRPPPPSPAAHFRLKHNAKGTARIDVKCADNEPTKACVDAAIELLKEVATMHGGGTATEPRPIPPAKP